MATDAAFSTAVVEQYIQSNYESGWTQNSPHLAMAMAKGRVSPAGAGWDVPARMPLAGNAAPAYVADSSGAGTGAYAAPSFANTGGMQLLKFKPCEIQIPIAVEEYYKENLVAGQGADYIQGIMDQNMDAMTNALISAYWANPLTGVADVVAGRSRQGMASILAALNRGKTNPGTDSQSPPESIQQLGTGESTAKIGTAGIGFVQTSGGALPDTTSTYGGVSRVASGSTTVIGGARWNTPCFIGASDGSAESIGPDILAKVYNAAVSGTYQPDLILVNSAIYSAIEAQITAGGGDTAWGVLDNNSMMAKLGFTAIRYKGADIVLDDRVPSLAYATGSSNVLGHQMFCINTRFLTFRFGGYKPSVDAKTPSILPKVRQITYDGRPIEAWVARLTGQMIATRIDRVHSRHCNLAV